MIEADFYAGCAADASTITHDDFVLLSSRVMAQQLSAAAAYAFGPPDWYRSDWATQGSPRNEEGRWWIATQPARMRAEGI